jgi:hypothetical protein
MSAVAIPLAFPIHPTAGTAGRNEHDMTDQTTPDITPEQAEAELATLEQQVIDGGDVTMADLTAAKERISFAHLVRTRNEKRAAEKQAKEAEAAQKAAKAEVTKLLSTSSTTIDDAKVAAKEALDLFIAQIEAHNKLVAQAGLIFDRAGLAQPNSTLVNPLDEPDLDLNFYATSYGGVYSAVQADGVLHRPAHAGGEYRKLVYEVADEHNLQTRGSASLAYKIGRD